MVLIVGKRKNYNEKCDHEDKSILVSLQYMFCKKKHSTILPVAAKADDWKRDSFSAGLARSPIPAITNA